MPSLKAGTGDVVEVGLWKRVGPTEPSFITVSLDEFGSGDPCPPLGKQPRRPFRTPCDPRASRGRRCIPRPAGPLRRRRVLQTLSLELPGGLHRNLTTNLDVEGVRRRAVAEDEDVPLRFTVVVAKYNLLSCTGKGRLERREQLLTEVMKSGYPETPDGLRAVTKAIKEGVKPTQQMLDRFACKFLGGKPLGYDLDTLMRLIDQAAGRNG
jgi:hypothetical protein